MYIYKVSFSQSEIYLDSQESVDSLLESHIAPEVENVEKILVQKHDEMGFSFES